MYAILFTIVMNKRNDEDANPNEKHIKSIEQNLNNKRITK